MSTYMKNYQRQVAGQQQAAQQKSQMKGYSSRLGQGRLNQNTALMKGGLLAQAADAVSHRVNPGSPAPQAPVGHDPNRTSQYLARIKGKMNAAKPKMANKGPYANTLRAYSRNFSAEQGANKRLYSTPAAPNANTRDEKQNQITAGNRYIRSMVYGGQR